MSDNRKRVRVTVRLCCNGVCCPTGEICCGTQCVAAEHCCANQPCFDECCNANCCPQGCEVCLDDGTLFEGTITVGPDVVCLGDTITFTASGVTDSGGLMELDCSSKMPISPVTPTYTWEITCPAPLLPLTVLIMVEPPQRDHSRQELEPIRPQRRRVISEGSRGPHPHLY